MKPTLLVVDDEVDNVDALERLFRRKYNVLKATSGSEAITLLKSNPQVAVILSDQRMPKMTGVEFLKKSIKSHPDAIRLLLTGYTDIDSVISAINSGEIYRYLTKPWDPVDLTNTIDKAFDKYGLREELKEKNRALEEALDELKTLDEAKNQFMVLVNHELKTPLTVITSFLGLLKETTLDEEQAKYTLRIEQSTERLQKLVDDVLELVSAETGLLPLNIKKTNVEKLIDPVISELDNEAQKRGQTLEFQPNSLSLKADTHIVQKVLHQIIHNAIKFGSKNSNITIAAETTDKGTTEFSVTNKGKGLPQKTVQKILRPFTLDEDIMHHSEGLGLGLSLSQALLKRHTSQLAIECPKGEVRVSFQI